MSLQDEVIQELLNWIDANIEQPLKIENVAIRSGYSKWHLQRLFNKIVNKPLGNYIRDKKLEKAAHDLMVTDASIISISLKYGFDSQQSFSRTFSQKYHVPPAYWRKRYRSPGCNKNNNREGL